MSRNNPRVIPGQSPLPSVNYTQQGLESLFAEPAYPSQNLVDDLMDARNRNSQRREDKAYRREERRIAKEKKGLEAALEAMRSEQGFVNDLGQKIVGDNFASPYDNISDLQRRKMFEKDAERVAGILEENPSIADDPMTELQNTLNNLTKPKPAESQDNNPNKPSVGGGRGDIVEKPGERAEFNDQLIEETFSGAMQDFISNVRGTGPATKEMSLEDYKKDFAEATGIDISGKPDTSQALMAMGLAMMQNKAGKGFNVGKMLSAVGKAGEAALPALSAAKQTARANVLAAGNYALQQRGVDRAADQQAKEAMMNRAGYYIYPKGKGGNFSNFDNGQIVRLNKYEMNKLMQDEDFAKQYDFIEANQYLDVLKERSKQPDYGDKYSSPTDISLIGQKEGAPEIFTVKAQLPDGNYKGAKPQYGHLQTNAEAVQRNIINEQKAILREAQKFEELAGLIQEGISIPEQAASAIVTFGRNLGLDWGDGPTSIKRAQTALKRIQTTNAKDILGEVGKTLSDTDRQIVRDVVGDINWLEADEKVILEKLGEVYKLVIDKRQENVNSAISNLEDQFGVRFRTEDFLEEDDGMSEEDMLAEVNEMRKRQGLEPRK